MSNNPEREPHAETPRAPDPQPSIIQPIIDELKGTTHPPQQNEVAPPPPGPVHPPQPAELDQDAGGGYNPDGTYPQT